TSGKGLEKLREIIAHQGGDPRVVDDPDRLPKTPKQTLVRAEQPGYVTNLQADLIGRAAMALGAGRDRVEDAIDPAVGLVVKAQRGEIVKAGDALAEVHYRDAARLGPALALLQGAWQIDELPPTQTSLILDT